MILDKIPLVSVIMCTYNDEQYIAESIESILGQSWKNLEFIIVNDGSTDQTKAIIQSFTDDRIVYLEHPNQGQEFSKNRGIDLARGKYIAYMDGDDISKPERIKTQVDFLETNPEIGVCSTGIKFFGNRDGAWMPPEKDESIRYRFLFNSAMAHPTCMIRREILEEHSIRYKQGWEAAEDYYFLSKVLEKTKGHCIQQLLYNYRFHGLNISVSKSEIQRNNARKISYSIFNEVLKLNLSRSEHAILLDLNKLETGEDELEKAVAIIRKIQLQIEKEKNLDNPLSRRLISNMFEKVFFCLYGNVIANPALFRFFMRNKIWKELPVRRFAFLYPRLLAKSMLGRAGKLWKPARNG